MHRLLDEVIGTTVVQLALFPIKGFLFVEPCLRQWLPTQSAEASAREFDHVERVVALQEFHTEIRADPSQERPGVLACRGPPGPACARFYASRRRRGRNDPATPGGLHPVQYHTIAIANNYLDAVIEPLFGRNK